MGITLTALAERVQTEADAYEFLEGLRWPSGDPVCPHCGNIGADYIAPANGATRRTRTGSLSQRRVWRCQGCRQQFSVLTGSPLHGTKISVRKWVFVIFEMCASKNGVSAREIERKYGLCPRTAWFMMHRVRELMAGDRLDTMAGTIVADETFIGGSLKNRHRSQIQPVPVIPGGERTSLPHRVPVLSLANRTTGEVHSRVVADVTGPTLRKAIAERVNMADSVLHTDGNLGYVQLGQEFIRHEAVNHIAGEYVRGDVSTNQAENFFSQLKRSLDGTHHHVSRKHLGRYLAEVDYRYTNRKISDTARMRMLVEATPMRRLTYEGTKAERRSLAAASLVSSGPTTKPQENDQLSLF